ncbi:hypothetical protein MMC15_000039 [Xylographa vitiligo]|nr:hypothetical protein [Xylographa vitiligo]
MPPNVPPQSTIDYLLVYDQHAKKLTRAEEITSTATQEVTKVEVDPKGHTDAVLKWVLKIPAEFKGKLEKLPGTAPCLDGVPCQESLDFAAFVELGSVIAGDRVVGIINFIFVKHCTCLDCLLSSVQRLNQPKK